MSDATRDLQLVRDAFADTREQFHDEQWVIDNITTALDIAIRIVAEASSGDGVELTFREHGVDLTFRE